MTTQDSPIGGGFGKIGTPIGDDISIQPNAPAVAGGDGGAEPMRDVEFPIELAPELPVTEGKPAVVSPVTAAEAAALELTDAQKTAIVKLTSGCSRVEAAAAAGISRMTLYRWLNHDPAFQCAYNAWQKDVVTTAQGQMLAATRDAMSTVITAIRKGDARLAWKLLESQGITKPALGGPTEVEELQRQETLDRKKREIAERKERNRVYQDEMNSMDGI